MTAMPPLMTADEFLALGDEGRGYELIDGRLEELDMSQGSSRVNFRVGRYLVEHCDTHGGWAFDAELGYRCFPNERRVRKADASYVSFATLPVESYADEGISTTPPDLVAEVLSPNDLARKVDAKVREWLSVGVKVVWVLQPETSTVRIHRAQGKGEILNEGDILTEPGLLPGFAVPVADLFRRPGPPPS